MSTNEPGAPLDHEEEKKWKRAEAVETADLIPMEIDAEAERIASLLPSERMLAEAGLVTRLKPQGVGVRDVRALVKAAVKAKEAEAKAKAKKDDDKAKEAAKPAPLTEEEIDNEIARIVATAAAARPPLEKALIERLRFVGWSEKDVRARIREVSDLNDTRLIERSEALGAAIKFLVLDLPTGKILDLRMKSPRLSDLNAVASFWAEGDEVGRGGKRVRLVDVWLKHPDRKATNCAPGLDPRIPFGWSQIEGEPKGIGKINTYSPFTPVLPIIEAELHWTMFRAMTGFVFPDEGDADWVLDWLATKIQRPWERQTAIVNFTSTQGTGRTAYWHISRMLLGAEFCAPMDASRLFGGRANQFNAHRVKLLITVNEVAEGDDHSDLGQKRMAQGVYNRLKEIVDPNDNRVSIERKGSEIEAVEIFTSYMIATNLGGGVPLEPGDRRFSVMRGNRLPLEGNRPDVIDWISMIRDAGSSASINALSAVHVELMRRDVSRYRPSVARVTDAMAQMIAEGKSQFDRAMESVIDLIMDKSLYKEVRKPHPEGVIVGTALEKLMVSDWMAARDKEAFSLATDLRNRGKLLRSISSFIRAHARVAEPLASTKNGNTQLRLPSGERVRVYLPHSQDRRHDSAWSHENLKTRVKSLLWVVDKLSRIT